VTVYVPGRLCEVDHVPAPHLVSSRTGRQFAGIVDEIRTVYEQQFCASASLPPVQNSATARSAMAIIDTIILLFMMNIPVS
jgi:hypothetical protein